jgi:hypothetical protein
VKREFSLETLSAMHRYGLAVLALALAAAL